MIENGTIESLAGTLLQGGPAVAVLLALLLAILLRYRTNSAHALLRWLWGRISGKPNGSDLAFNGFMDAQDNLMQFRFISGKARTVAQMHSLINWSRSHNEDFGDINACGPHFDRGLPGLKAVHQRPTELTLFGITMGLGVIAFLFIVSTPFASVQGALFTVKDTNTWLLIDMQSVRSVLDPGGRRLARDQCPQPIGQKLASSGFGGRDVTVVCNFYADPESSKFIHRTVGEQLRLFGPVAVALLAFFWFTRKQLLQGQAAIRMASRLGRPRP